jgi:hypothetical protein
MRLIVAAISCAAIPILVIVAYLRWRKDIRRELRSWRNGAALASMFIVLVLWLIQTARWVFLSLNPDFTGLLGADWREIETFLPAYYAYPALPLAFALKGIPRLLMIAAWFFLAFFYRVFWYE